MNPFDMNSMPGGFGRGGEDVNLLSILINIIFGVVVGLVVFIGFTEVIKFGSKVAGQLIKLSGYGQQMAMFGFATSAAPYIVLAPILGLVAKQLSSVRTLKGFAYFLAAVLVGFVTVFFTQGYFATLMK